jgi:hypothetical protein
MLDLHNSHTLPQDFLTYLSPYVLPLSLEEYWDYFFENEAPYFTRVDNSTVTRWVQHSNQDYSQWQNRKVKQHREVKVDV